jgi:hypothetical protein
MEVHAHAHTARKKFTHYLWEFIMLFLAVFCGFLAEYQLEHKIEKDRELQFIKSLVEDLKDDETVIQQNVTTNRSRVELLDSFLTAISSPAQLQQNGNNIYYMARVGPRISILSTNNKTFDQLKNSGSFRLIHKNESANKIMEYYNMLPKIKELEALYLEEFAHYKSIASKLLDPVMLRSMELSNGDISRDANNPQLRTTNPDLLKELGVYIVYMNGSTRSIVPLEEQLLQSAKKLREYLINSYHLN